MEIAVQHHQAGRLADAEGTCRQILGQEPNHPDALHLLGVLASQAGQPEVALDLIRRAIAGSPGSASFHSNLGLVLSGLGRMDEAIAAQQRALQIRPDFAGARNNLGNALSQRGRFDEAIAEYRQAIQSTPAFAEAHYNLGNILSHQGCFGEAVAAYRRVVQIAPDFAGAHNNLGFALTNAGQPVEAIAAYRRAVQLQPDFAEALNNLGFLLSQQGHPDEALSACRRALEIKPDFAEAHNHLGLVLSGLGRREEAVAALRRALQLKPDFAEAGNNLGNVLSDQGQLDEAVAMYQRAIASRPEYVDAYINLGNTLSSRGQAEEAIATYRKALELAPDSAKAHYNLANVLNGQCEVGAAIAKFRQAIHFMPDFADAHNNLGGALSHQGRLDEAIAAYRRVLELEPDSPDAHSNLLLCLHYLPTMNAPELAAERARWNRLHGAPLRPAIRPHDNDASPDRRLRIGYVSADFRDHVVGRTLLPCFEAHDRTQFDLVCYSGTTPADPIGERFRTLSALWCETAALSDEQMAARIRADRIDILVDLSLHTADNRLPVFARKPAPVQVSWLGYPGTTGLETMDYRITDACLEPPGMEESAGSEQPWRLPDCWTCYGAMGESPAPGEPPLARGGRVTFGSFNNFAKINERVLGVWAEILHAVPGSRLVLLSRACPQMQAVSFLEARGIAPDRVEFLNYFPASSIHRGERPATACLERYREIDIALDPFPYNGMTTTCDALWMGVPVIALIGGMSLGRASFSLLSNVGLPELAAPTERDYVRVATELAGDLPRLADLRATLRARMRQSPLLDAPRFARNLEAAYRDIWQRWCERHT